MIFYDFKDRIRPLLVRYCEYSTDGTGGEDDKINGYTGHAQLHPSRCILLTTIINIFRPERFPFKVYLTLFLYTPVLSDIDSYNTAMVVLVTGPVYFSSLVSSLIRNVMDPANVIVYI